MESSDDDVVGAPDPQLPRGNVARGNYRARVRSKLFLIIACAYGWYNTISYQDFDGDLQIEGNTALLVGACIASWKFVGSSETYEDGHPEVFQAAQPTRAGRTFGYVAYSVEQSYEVQPRDIDDYGDHDYLVGQISEAFLKDDPSTSLYDIYEKLKTGKHVVDGLEVVRMAPQMAKRLVHGMCSIMHVVPVTQRIPGKIRLSEFPSKLQLKRFMDAGGPADAIAKRPRTLAQDRKIMQWRQKTPVDKLLQLIAASAELRDIGRMDFAIDKFAKLFAHDSLESSEELAARVGSVATEVIRYGRIRLDYVSSLMQRRYFEMVNWDELDVQLGADASPQKHGMELFAASYSLFRNGVHRFSYLPFVNATLGFSAESKVLTLLFQIFLICGPTFLAMRSFCYRVRSILTDQGTERLIASWHDVLPAFCKIMGIPIGDCTKQRSLFPRAVQVPGWRHIWDGVLKRILNSLDFFPEWVKHYKAVVSTLRNRQFTKRVSKDFDGRGLHGLASMLRNFSIPSFAKWRWTTLHESTKALLTIWSSFVAYFDGAVFASDNRRDAVEWSSFLYATISSHFTLVLQWIAWISAWLGNLSSWIGGCDCHEAELLAGEEVECVMKGRRIERAYDYAMQVLDHGRTTAASWTARGHFRGNAGMCSQMQGAIRMGWKLGKEKISFLNDVPYIFSRLDEPGIKDRVVQQWNETTPEMHEAATREVLAEGSSLREAVDSIDEHGNIESNALRREVNSMKMVYMDDSTCERPHALMSKNALSGRASEFPWLASTSRLQQNLDDVEELSELTGADLETEWYRATSVLQVDPRKAARPKRMTRRCAEDCIYHLAMLRDKPFPSKMAEDNEDDDTMDGPGDGGNGRSEQADGVAGVLACLDQTGNDDAEQGGDGSMAPGEHVEVRLLRDYLGSCLDKFSYFSIARVDSDPVNEPLHDAYQVLSKNPRDVLVQTYRERTKEKLLYSCEVQPFDQWISFGNAFNEVDVLDCYAIADPITVDLIALLGSSTSARSRLFRWSVGESDVAGCFLLHSPQPLSSHLRLMDVQVPILCLLDKLAEDGFTGNPHTVEHKSTAALEDKSYDCRNVASRRHYLKCVLAQEELFSHAVTTFKSDRSDAYYKLMLTTKSDVDPTTSAKDCLAKLKDESCPKLKLECLNVAPPRPQLALAIEDDVSGGGDHLSLLDLVPLAIENGQEQEDDAESASSRSTTNSSSSSSSSESSSSGSSLAEVAGGGEVELSIHGKPSWLPKSIQGQNVTWECHYDDEGQPYGGGMRIKCPNKLHNHSLFRSLHLDTDAFGPRASEYYLGAWAMKAFDVGDDKRAHAKPTRAEVREYKETYG